jgi:ATP-dependent DNA ligase
VPVPFHELKLLYPPHPAITWTPDSIHKIRNFVPQLKFDDWRVLIYFSPGGKIEFYNRDRRKYSRYQVPKALLDSLESLGLSPEHFHVLDGGLLHYKTAPRIRNTLVLWDILVHDGEYLLGTTYRERYALLEKIMGRPKSFVTLDSVQVGLKYRKNLWLAPNFKGDPEKLFKAAIRVPEIEGLVMKDLAAKLERSHKKNGNAKWMIRIRRPRIDYFF